MDYSTSFYKLEKEVVVNEGRYQEYIPSKKLRPLVRKYFFTEGFSIFSDIKINPISKEYVEMVIHFGKDDIEIYNEQIKCFERRKAFIVGSQPFKKLNTCRITGKLNMFSVEFNHLGLKTIFGKNPKDFFNQIIEVEKLMGKNSTQYLFQIRNTQNNNERVELTELMLAQLIEENSSYENKEDKIMLYLDNKELSGKKVKDVCEDLNITRRSLERYFEDIIGFTPKEYIRVSRFNKACSILGRHPLTNIIDIVNDCDYFDQSHFIREFKEHIDYSPFRYIQDANSLLYFGRGYILPSATTS